MLPDTGNTREQIERNKQGVEDINDRSNRVFRRVSKPAVTTPANPVRLARAIENAPAGNEILANLFDSSGIEITEGDKSGITVICQISGGSDLNEATRRLANGDKLFVIEITISVEETPTLAWHAVEGFQGTESDIGIIRRAKVTEDAPDDEMILANLYNSATGVEEHPSVIVYCNISGEMDMLNAAIPRLKNRDEEKDVIFVTNMIVLVDGVPEARWICLSNFQDAKKCVCEEPE